MTKQEILDYFSLIDFAYNESGRHDSLSRMLDELLKEQDSVEHAKEVLCKNGWEKLRYPSGTIGKWDDPEIVRCKDCVYWQDNNDGYPHIGCKWREDETPDPDDFCSAGERKE